MTDSTPISCDHYDYLEIACMDGYQLAVELDGDSLIGIAKTLKAKNGLEYLVLKVDDEEHWVPVNRIQRIRVLTEPARFREHQFQ